jgi:hypothetical protein
VKDQLLRMMEEIGAPGRDFWEQDLEIPARQIAIQAARPGYLTRWVAGRTGRQAELLRRLLAFGGIKPTMDQGTAVHGYVAVLPYLLVYEFAKYKSPAAVAEHAQHVLPEDLLEPCRKQTGDFDKVSLCFALYHHDPAELSLILCLDKVYKCGFARMRLVENLRRRKQSLAEFLSREMAADVLSAFDRSQADRRTSELKRILPGDAHLLVFIRRGLRPGKVFQEGRLVHGYLPEWIVLEFRDAAKRVSIASKSIKEPLEIANRMASAYYGTPCTYENENLLTHRQQLKLLLRQLQDDQSPELRLVELARARSPLDGAPDVRMVGATSISLGRAIDHFDYSVGRLLADVEHIESVKVVFCGKRVTLRFEPSGEDTFVVRYSDQRLSPAQRIQFENYLRSHHGITALSVEKRFCRAA